MNSVKEKKKIRRLRSAACRRMKPKPKQSIILILYIPQEPLKGPPGSPDPTIKTSPLVSTQRKRSFLKLIKETGVGCVKGGGCTGFISF